MTRPEDGRDGGIYSSDSTGQTPSLASIYQVGSDDLNLAHIYRVSQKNALSESSSCKLTPQIFDPRTLCFSSEPEVLNLISLRCQLAG